jgi:hypothetical protein
MRPASGLGTTVVAGLSEVAPGFALSGLSSSTSLQQVFESL